MTTTQKEYMDNDWARSWDIKQTLGIKYTGWKLVWVAIKAAFKKTRVPLEPYDVCISVYHKPKDTEVKFEGWGVSVEEGLISDKTT